MPYMVAAYFIASALTEVVASYLVASLIATAITTVLRSALSKKPSAPSPQDSAQNRLASVRMPISPRQYIYGEVRTAGTLTFIELSADGNFSYALFTLSGHELHAIRDLFFDGEDALIGTGDDTDHGAPAQGRFSNSASVIRSLGSEAGQPFNYLVGVSAGKWTDAHRQSGCGKVLLFFRNRADVFKRGMPNLNALVQGRECYDPRTATTLFTRNAALCLNDYLTASFGVGADYASEIDETALTAAANVCDERVLVAGDTATFTASASADTVTLAAGARTPAAGDAVILSTTGTLPAGLSPATVYYAIASATGVIKLATTPANAAAGTAINITDAGTGTHTLTYLANFTVDATTDALTLAAGSKTPRIGDGVRVSSSGTLPAGLAAATTYYAIRGDSGRIKLATTQAHALAGTAIDITSEGTGTHTLTWYDEARFSLDGTLLASAQPKEVIGTMLAAMAGKAVNVGGKWFLYAGAYDAPTVTLTETDLSGPIQVQNLVSRRDNANGIKGIFTDPNSDWQPVTFPPLASTTYMTEDGGERVWKDIDLAAFVTSGSQAQRLAKIELLGLRQALTVRAQCKLTAWAAVTGATVAMTNAKFGWSAKAFEVMASRFIADASGTLGVELELRETAAAIFDWSTSEEQTVDLAPNTTLAVGAADVTGLSVQQNGQTVVLQWDPITNDQNLIEYEIRFSTQDVDDWDLAGVLATAPAGFGHTTAMLAPGIRRYYIKARNAFGYSANAADITADTTSGAFLALAANAEAPAWVKRDTALRFGGTTADYLTLAFALAGTNSALGAAFWFTPETLPSSGYANLLSSVVTTQGFALKIDSATGKLYGYVSDGTHTVQGTIGSTTLTAGRRRHVALDLDDASASPRILTVYLDGQLLGTLDVSTVTGSISSGTYRAGLGADGTGPFKGAFDELLIYLDGLTADEALSIYLGEEVRELDLRLHAIASYVTKCRYAYGFDEGSGTLAYNRLNIGLDACTLNGNVTWVPSRSTSKFVLHWTGVLVPDDRFLVTNYTWATAGDSFCPNPFRFCRWEAQTIDLAVDAYARVYGPILSYLMPGKTSGRPIPVLQMKIGDTDDNNIDGYPAYQNWTIGLGSKATLPLFGSSSIVTTFRYLRTRLVLDTDVGAARISQFTPSADAEFYTQAAEGLVVAGGGTAVTFDPPFHATPNIQISGAAAGAGAAGYTAASKTGFTAHANADAGGTVNWNARGA